MIPKPPTRKLPTNLLRHLLFCLTLSAVITKFTSCCKGCGDDYLSVYFQNYTRAEIDTIIQLRYEINSDFSVLLDSSLIDNSTNRTDYPQILQPDADYIIQIPSVQKVFKVSGYQFRRCRSCGGSRDVLSGFKLNDENKNGTFVTFPR
jgi:hypothetical protein